MVIGDFFNWAIAYRGSLFHPPSSCLTYFDQVRHASNEGAPDTVLMQKDTPMEDGILDGLAAGVVDEVEVITVSVS